MSYPENDAWLYKTQKSKRAFTSSEFVAMALSKLGVLAGTEVNFAEFTPRDVYELAIFDKL